MKIFRSLAAGASALLLVSGLAACSTGPSNGSSNSGGSTPAADCKPEYEFKTLKEGVLQVAGMNELPSFLGNNASGPFQGFSVELMEQFAKQNCLTIEWTPGTGAATQLLAADGKVDVWVGIIIASAKRAEVMALQEHQLYFEFAGIASKKSDGFSSVEDLKGRQVAAVTGSNYVPSMQEALGEANVKLYQSSDEAFQDLKNGRVEAVITPSSPQAYWVSQNAADTLVSKIIEKDDKYPVLTQAYKVVWPVNKSNNDLVSALSSYFKTVNDDGQLKKLLKDKGITDELHFTGR